MDGFSPSSVIIEPSALKELMDARDPRLVILDSSFVMPGAAEDPYEVFKRKRIPGARFFDIEAFADHGSPLPHMLCNAESFAAKAGALGIGNDSLIVVYGQGGMIMGPARGWWSFKAYGHPQVLVLNGGLPAWIAEGYGIEDAAPALPPMRSYEAEALPKHLASIEDVQAALGSEIKIFDARPADRFKGIVPEPRPGLRSGHIPGSASVPCSQLVDASGKFKDKAQIRALFENQGLLPESDVILTCGSGVTACALALGLAYLGVSSWRIYDGSWAEWGQEGSKTPVSRGWR